MQVFASFLILVFLKTVSSQSSIYGIPLTVCAVNSSSDMYRVGYAPVPSSHGSNYYTSEPANSDLECALLCKRDFGVCISALWDPNTRTCQLSSTILGAQDPNSHSLNASAMGNLQAVTMVSLNTNVLKKGVIDRSSECTVQNCAAGAHTCRRECSNNTSVCMAPLESCDQIPVSNIRHWYWKSWESDADHDVLLNITYKKRYNFTSLRVQYRGTFMGAHNEQNACSRWYFTFNDRECQTPGSIEAVWASSVKLNYRRSGRVDGICENLPAGDVSVKFNIGPCSNLSVSDSYTGWKSGDSITVEEDDLRYGSGFCRALSRFNTRQYVWREESNTTNGLLRSFDYYKRDVGTAIHVIYQTTFRAAGHGSVRYSIKFNSNECTSPGEISSMVAHNNQFFTHAIDDGTNMVSGMCDNIEAGHVVISIHIEVITESPDGYTGWNANSRLVVEEIRYDQDISAVITTDGAAHRLPEHNIHQFLSRALSDGTQIGPINGMHGVYVKQSPLSYIRVYYQGDVRITVSCSRWYLTFNGNECFEPGPIEGIVHQENLQDYNKDNRHHPFIIDGFCKLPAASYTIRLNVQNCAGFSGRTHAFTCWNVPCRLIAQEVYLEDMVTVG